MNDRLAELKTRAQTLYRRANDLSGGALAIVRQAFKNFGEAQASGAAASVAYYALFSLFPLLLALAAAGSFFLEDEQAYQETIALISNAIPVSQDLIVQNIRQVLASRGTVGLIGLVGLLWSATGVFMNLARNINRAWSHATERGFLKGRLVALAMVGVLALLLILSVLSTALLNLLPRLRIPLLGNLNVYDTALWPIVSGLVPWLFGWLLFLALYRWVPNTSVPWSAALWGAGVASLLWEVAKKGFAWYLEAGLARYSLVYGSLGTVVALVVAALIGTANWRSPFIYFAIPGLILGVLVFLFIREPERGAALSLEPLLPDDEEPTPVRAAALANAWLLYCSTMLARVSRTSGVSVLATVSIRRVISSRPRAFPEDPIGRGDCASCSMWPSARSTEKS